MLRKFRGHRYMDLNLGPAQAVAELHRGESVTRCRTKNCRQRATTIARKLHAFGRSIRQIELCDRHAEAMAARERVRGLKLVDERGATCERLA